MSWWRMQMACYLWISKKLGTDGKSETNEKNWDDEREANINILLVGCIWMSREQYTSYIV